MTAMLLSDLRELWAACSPVERASLEGRMAWLEKARPTQITPESLWKVWLILAGRGWGKTRTGAEDVAWYGQRFPGSRIAIVAPTYADARDTCIEGDSGLRAVLPNGVVEAWNRSIGELTLVNGTRYKLFGAEEPERLRGPQHHRAWADELGAWKRAETWDQLMFGLRLGDDPRVVVTTTPKPNPLVRGIAARDDVYITRGSTFENADNLAASALDDFRRRYEGTRLGRQELYAEILDDVPGALWTRAMIDNARVTPDKLPEMSRVCVAVDPSGAASADDEGADEIGIVVVGRGVDGRGYVLEDASCRLSPEGWARRAVTAYHRWSADRIVAERNYGGAMVSAVIRSVDRSVSFKEVVASRGKTVRAEPVAALYEQGRVSHAGLFDELETQMMAFTAGGYVGEGSPDRADAAVWGLTEVMLGHVAAPRAASAVVVPAMSVARHR